jgi:hypothetical protein
MIQLADAYLFILSGLHQPRKGYIAEGMKEALQGVDIFPTRYKIWPG